MLVARCQLRAPSPLVVKRKAKAWKFVGEFLWRRSFQKDEAAFAKWTKNQLIDLGPTYTKLGQAASTRSDLFPNTIWVDELTTLQDDVPEEKIDVQSLLSMQNFECIDAKPFASASIGQVYRGRLKDGTEIVVKAKRSGIYERMQEDTDNLRTIIRFVEAIGVDTGTGSNYILEDTIRNLLLEADYQHEMANAARFYDNFKDVPYVRIPRVYSELSSDDVIVMEYVEGCKLDELPPTVNKSRVCEALISTYVIMCFDFGFFHADPHPGNISFSIESGALVFYDYGVAVEIDDATKHGFFKLLGCAVQRDTRALVACLVDLEIIVPTSTDTLDVEAFFEKILKYLENVDPNELKDQLTSDETMLELAAQKPFILPTFIVFLARAFTMVEGQLKRLDPEFSYYNYLEPIMTKHISQSVDLKGMLTSTARLPATIQNINTTVLNLEKQRSAMRRSLKRTRAEVRNAQYSILCALLSAQYENATVSVFFACLAVYFSTRRFISRKS